MWFNFFKLSVRRIVRDAGFSAINIGGLAIGLTAFILILEYIDFETNYDQSDISENVFRVQNNYIRHGELIYNTAATFPGVGPNMAEYFPQVESYGRIYPWSKLVKCSIVLPDSGPDNKVFIEENVAYADPSILNLLSIKMISGNPGTALNEPGLVIISESLATKYFANSDPVGQHFALEDSHVGSVELEVSGVFEDTPENSHANLDVLISYKTLYLRVEYRGDPAEISFEEDMGDYHFYTYILVNQPSDISRITEQMPGFLDHYKPGYMEVNKQGERMRTNQFTFTNLEDIHLRSDLQFEFGVNNKEEKVGFLGVTAVFILILAWVNYINLYTSKSVERAKEVGIRKVVGSSKRVLVLQFLIESFLINLFAFILAMTVIQVVQPFFNELTGRSLSLWQIEPLRLTAIMGTILILGSLISGFYPSWILSNYKPSTVLKGKFEAYGAGAILKRALVIFQFVVSTGLMACMLGVISQMNYMREVEIGFDIDRIVVIEKPAVPDETMGKASEKFKSDLLRLSMVEEVGG
ncbi:MAG: ABC transporter permease, partial [Bacteroidetes bacterium]|nr:ABC transporter permease [Bacteroidota bacterium]